MDNKSALDVIDFKKSIIKNIGYELYNKELIVTLILYSNNFTVGNLIFYDFELIEKLGYVSANSQIEEISYSKTDDISRISINVSNKIDVGLFNLVFYAKTMEWEQLNLYYEYRFDS